jgi:hypothetical protein
MFTSVAWSPDGKTLASASRDKTVRLWDSAEGRHLRSLEGHSDEVTQVAWSPDGKTLASASQDKTVRLWNSADGRHLRSLEGHSYGVTSVAWSPDGKTLASAGYDGTWLWDSASGRQLRSLQGHSDTVDSVAFSPDGLTLASASNDGSVRVWEPRGALAMVLWAGGDGWVAWRAQQAEEHRLLRGENGNLVRHRTESGAIEAMLPKAGRKPTLSAEAKVKRPAAPGEMGEISLTVRNATDASPALWVELRDRQPTRGAAKLVVRPPPTLLRLEPGATTVLPIEYTPTLRGNHPPATIKAVLELHHAYDGGKPIDVPVELALLAPRDCMSPTDIAKVRKFLNDVRLLLRKKDSAGILDLIAFPLEVDNERTVEREPFIATYYATVSRYLLRSTIDRSEISSLQRSEAFAPIDGRPGCYSYGIFNAFPDLEFNVNFQIEMRGGRLKIVALRIAG